MKRGKTEEELLREQLVELIDQGNAHANFEQVTQNISLPTIGTRPFALLIADHTSYHTGEIIVLRRLLNDWE